jgi:quinol monooxygenase YgiN
VPDFLLTIDVKPGREDVALETLAEIERLSHQDEGCVTFVWLQHDDDPLRFTLFEQWETQEHLDTHLTRIIPRWQQFEPHLAGEPVSHQVRTVVRARAEHLAGA